MTTKEKLDKLKEFNDENDFRGFLIDLLKKMGFSSVLHTHRYGSPEQGKDIIAKYHHELEGNEWYAFVVKVGRIGGGTNEIETIKNQVKQAFEYPYKGIDNNKQKINKVKIVTNENFTSGAQNQISESPELSVYSNYEFWWNEPLIDKIDKYYPEFWLPGDAFSKEYSSVFSNKIKAEFELRELSIKKIDDKKLQRLIDIFIEPKLTESVIEEDRKTKEKRLVIKNLHISSFDEIKENMLLAGEQGSGKTKVLNRIACQLANIDNISKNQTLPIKLKAPCLKEGSFDIESAVINELKSSSQIFFDHKLINDYKKILLVDDFDFLKKSDKQTLMDSLQDYCKSNHAFYVITYRKNEFDYDKDIRTIKIHNFNTKQIVAFVSMYFEGNTKGEKLISVLKESDILSRLPTTPLTITLISLLFEENSYEIPATLTDIYSDFTAILLGKLDIKNRTDLLMFNIKRRLFSALALMMLDKNIYNISFDDFSAFINDFLIQRGYQEQTNDELFEIIDKSGLLFIDDFSIIGFKQQAFIEFLASIEIYHHKRENYYDRMLENFNDVIWQNTTIFYAGHSKELYGIIDDVIAKAPNNDLKDWFINSGGMGYLAQALYLTKPEERMKLVLKALDSLILAYNDLKTLSKEKETFITNIPLPIVSSIVNFWFNENFKSITLKTTLENTFNELLANSFSESINEFYNDFKLLMIATALMNPYIGEPKYLEQLLDKKSFMNHPILPLVAEMAIDIGFVDKKKISDVTKGRIRKEINKKKEYIKAVLKEPAYRFDNNFALED